MNKKTIPLLLVLAILFLLVLNKWQPWQRETAGSAPGVNRGDPVAINVRAHVVNAGDVENEIIATGTVLPNESVELHSEMAGRVITINFKEGSHVRKGDLLVKINDADLQAQLQRIQVQLTLAEDNEERQRKQLVIEAVSRESYESVRNLLEVAKAELQLIQAQIEKSSITAPFDGVIGLRYISEGSYLTPDTRIATLVDNDPVKIDFSVPERYAGYVSIGQSIRFILQGFAEPFDGRIYAMEPQIDTDIRSIRCRGLCANPRGRIRPGAFTEVNITLETLKGTLMIPSEALIPDAQQQMVYKVNKSHVLPTAVIIGLRTPERVQILSGLASGDTVLTTGLLQVRPGNLVKVTAIDEGAKL